QYNAAEELSRTNYNRLRLIPLGHRDEFTLRATLSVLSFHPMYARIRHMRRTTLFVEESVDHEIHALARRKGVPVSALVRESLARYLEEQKRGQTFTLRFLGQGHSGRKDIAERHEDLLWRDFGHRSSNGRQQGRV